MRNTALNPGLTLPLLILAHYTRKGQQLSYGLETALRRLKFLVYLGIVRLLNGFLSRGAQNNWTSSKYEWNKEVIVITGGSDGIGKNIALLLADKGVKIASLDIRPPTYAPRMPILPNSHHPMGSDGLCLGPNISHYTCDITSASSVREVAETVRSTLGNPTILINNAGIATGLTILSGTDESVQRTFEVNSLSHFRLVREFVPAMVDANHGTVVTIASIAACVSTANIVDYSCSKSAALAFHEGLATELKLTHKAPKVRTLCVCPSWGTYTRSPNCHFPTVFRVVEHVLRVLYSKDTSYSSALTRERKY